MGLKSDLSSEEAKPSGASQGGTSKLGRDRRARAYKLLLLLFIVPMLLLPLVSLGTALQGTLNARLTTLLDELFISDGSASDLERECPQVPRSWPSALHTAANSTTEEAAYASLLSQAVKYDTSIGDNWPSPTQDPERWKTTFEPFKQWLSKAFPRAHADERVSLEVINQHALIYTWKGSDEQLKPALLTAHQGKSCTRSNSLGAVHI